jgi:hypothetical protein
MDVSSYFDQAASFSPKRFDQVVAQAEEKNQLK